MGTGSPIGKKVNIFILVLQGPSFAKGKPRAARPSSWGGYEMRRRCFTCGPRAGWRFLQPLPGRGRAAAARSRPFMSPCSWEWAVPVNTTGGSRTSAKQAARTHLGFHQLPAHCGSLSPLRPNPQTPAPLQGGESHPHLASVRPGEL